MSEYIDSTKVQLIETLHARDKAIRRLTSEMHLSVSNAGKDLLAKVTEQQVEICTLRHEFKMLQAGAARQVEQLAAANDPERMMYEELCKRLERAEKQIAAAKELAEHIASVDRFDCCPDAVHSHEIVYHYEKMADNYLAKWHKDDVK